METIIFKAPNGTKAKLRSLSPNVSALLRDQVTRLLEKRPAPGSAHEKARHLCGCLDGTAPANLSTTKEYLRQYGRKDPH